MLKAPLSNDELSVQVLDSWENLLKDFTYKKNWDFGYEWNVDFNWGRIWVHVKLQNSRPNGQVPEAEDIVTINNCCYVGPAKDYTVAEALTLLRSLIADTELHEMDEWIRYKEKLEFDPHHEEQFSMDRR